MELGIKGRVALVCASSRGLGLATAKALAREGADLFLCSRSEADLEQVAKEISLETGVRVRYLAIDLKNEESAKTLASQALRDYGRIDILVNNVGGPKPTKAFETKSSEWQAGFEQIFITAATLTSCLLPQMRQQKWGRIITITSLSVLEPIENLAISTSMRLAVTGYTKTLADEVAKDGITVNTVLPGVIHTERIENLRKVKAEALGTTLADEIKKTEATIPMGRLGRPDELAQFVAFLSSVHASYITGTHTPIDGGLRRGV